jgi:hypothetical protein
MLDIAEDVGRSNRAFDGRTTWRRSCKSGRLEMLSLSLWAWAAIGAGAVVAGIGVRWGVTDYLLDRFG